MRPDQFNYFVLKCIKDSWSSNPRTSTKLSVVGPVTGSFSKSCGEFAYVGVGGEGLLVCHKRTSCVAREYSARISFGVQATIRSPDDNSSLIPEMIAKTLQMIGYMTLAPAKYDMHKLVPKWDEIESLETTDFETVTWYGPTHSGHSAHKRDPNLIVGKKLDDIIPMLIGSYYSTIEKTGTGPTVIYV